MLDSKMYVLFLLNEDDDLFILYNFCVKMMPFKLKIEETNCLEGKKI